MKLLVPALVLVICASHTLAEDQSEAVLFVDKECEHARTNGESFRLQVKGICAEAVCKVDTFLNKKTRKTDYYLKSSEVELCPEIQSNRKGCVLQAGKPDSLFPDCCQTILCNGLPIVEKVAPVNLKLVVV